VGKISGQNRQKKQSEGVRFVYLALKIQCHIVKNTLLHTAFLAILPTRQFTNFNSPLWSTVWSTQLRNSFSFTNTQTIDGINNRPFRAELRMSFNSSPYRFFIWSCFASIVSLKLCLLPAY